MINCVEMDFKFNKYLKIDLLSLRVILKMLHLYFQIFIENMMRAAGRIGFTIARPRLIGIADDRTDTYAGTLSKLTDQSKPQLILCVVSNNQAMRYAAIKKKLCIDRPVPSQVILARTLTQKSQTMMNAIGCKVATQLNCKIGGYPWTVQLGGLLPGLMIVGFDVCHDKKSGGSYGKTICVFSYKPFLHVNDPNFLSSENRNFLFDKAMID